MTTPAWFWPTSGVARGSAMAALGSGFAVADWTACRVWPFSPASGAFGSAVTLPGVSAVYPGIVGIAPASSGRAYALNAVGQLWTVPSEGVFPSGYVPQVIPAPSGIWTGLAAGGPSGLALMVASSGYFTDSAGSVSGNFNRAPALYAVADANSLYTLLPSVPAVGTATLPGGVTGTIALPAALALPSCLALSGSASGDVIAVGGWQVAPPLPGSASAALNPMFPTYMIGVGPGTAQLWSAPVQYSDAWSLIQTVTGTANLNATTWRPDGVQALATSVSSGVVQAFTLGGSALSLAQTLAVSGACSVAVAGDSLHALVAQSGQAQATPLLFSGGVWAAGAAVTGLAGITALSMISTTGAYAACTAGLVPLILSGGVWAVSGSAIGLGFAPKVLTTGIYGGTFVAGSGAVAQVISGSVVTSGSWPGGTPTAIVVQQGRVIMTVPSDGLLRMFAVSGPGLMTQQSSTALTSGAGVGLGLSTTSLFVCGSGSTPMFGFSGTPFQLTVPYAGAVGVYVSGTGWTTTPLGTGHKPSALAFDASGNVQVVTQQNTWWTLSGGTVTASGVVPQYPGQLQSVPLGPSALLPYGGHLFCATSLAGVLVELY